MNRITGRVIKAISGTFLVSSEGGEYLCTGRGRIKAQENEICAGDMVEFSKNTAGSGVVEKCLPRTNFLVRPPVANVEQVVVVIASSPVPDFVLVDKIIVKAILENIRVVLCVNKTDINEEPFHRRVLEDYAGVVDKMLFLSARLGTNLTELRDELRGKMSCLVGQSAVGKSSITNELLGESVSLVGELSVKGGRGKHTTRHSEILRLAEGGYIVDTPGFTFLNIFERFDPALLAGYYPDFNEYAEGCRFRGCSHINEPDCAVKRAVEDGKISPRRYERYVSIHADCKKRWDNRY